MEYVYVGKIINTHGIKGELKINSDFKYKDDIFIKDAIIYIDDIEHVISNVRDHKNYKLILFDSFNNINEVLKFKGKDVYVLRKNINKMLSTDLINFEVIVGSKNIGKVNDILSNGPQEILVVGSVMIPYVDFFVKEIDMNNKIIYINEIEGLVE